MTNLQALVKERCKCKRQHVSIWLLAWHQLSNADWHRPFAGPAYRKGTPLPHYPEMVRCSSNLPEHDDRFSDRNVMRLKPEAKLPHPPLQLQLSALREMNAGGPFT